MLVIDEGSDYRTARMVSEGSRQSQMPSRERTTFKKDGLSTLGTQDA